MIAGSSGVTLPEPCGSTKILTPAALAACSSPSAAMKVWAMPVGQAVTATSEGISALPPSGSAAVAAAAAAGAA